MKSPRPSPSKSLQQSLAESLKQAVPTRAATEKLVGRPIAAPVEVVSTASAPPDAIPLVPKRIGRTTITVRGTDQDKIDQILALLLQSRRHRGGVTEAVCIALRLCPLDPEQIERAWDTIRAEDGRIKRRKQ